PFAASFFIITRFEEYLETEKGKYNCYPAEKSILFLNNRLKKPVVNIWANLLAEKIKEHYPEFRTAEPEFRYLSTIDIDNAWAFRNKGVLRSIGACIKDIVTGRLGNNILRIKSWANNKIDPYNTYLYLDKVFAGNEKDVIFFFLLGDYKKYDKNISHKNKEFRKLIRETSIKYSVGIHPSFFSSTKEGKQNLEKEIDRLKVIMGKKPYKSRQHFLRLFFPSTYQRLVEQGISEDYSMGYSSQTGFRAGICTPYCFYDLKNEKETTLKIYPFQVMDVTLREYLGLNVEEAKNEISNLIEEVKKAGGTFISIWHNESLSNLDNWKGYREVFEFMNEKGFGLSNE
ncbi:MAG: polysaccharide deacetylase family protein, partial [Prolixibacteraceae bacterium]|nr:polysaccharide deacetylase family protein [Prolixibacteraceae bacterium]